MLLLSALRREHSGDAFRIDIPLPKEGLRPGPISGSIRIRTNDERFPELVVSARGVMSRVRLQVCAFGRVIA
jgi:hypothetical protein